MYCLEIDPPLDGCQDQPLKEVSFHVVHRRLYTVVFLKGSWNEEQENLQA